MLNLFFIINPNIYALSCLPEEKYSTLEKHSFHL